MSKSAAFSRIRRDVLCIVEALPPGKVTTSQSIGDATKAFFMDLGLVLEGQADVEGPMVGTPIGLKDVKSTIAMMRTPHAHVYKRR